MVIVMLAAVLLLPGLLGILLLTEFANRRSSREWAPEPVLPEAIPLNGHSNKAQAGIGALARC